MLTPCRFSWKTLSLLCLLVTLSLANASGQCSPDITAPVISGCPATITVNAAQGACQGKVTAFTNAPTLAEELDQKSEYPGPFAIGGDLWQSFIAGKTGKLTKVGLLSSNASGRGGTLVIYLGEGTGGTVLYSGTYFIPSSGWQYQSLPFFQAPTVTAGVQYTVRWTDAVVLLACCYPGGHSSQNQMYDDINFATYVQAIPAGVSATDNCSAVTVTANYTEGANFPVGTTSVTYTARDASNNTATCSFNVVVVDNQSPGISCPANITQQALLGNCTAVITVPAPTVSDNCGIASTINSFNNTTNASGTYPKGITNVTWTTTDVNGRTSSCVQSVTVTQLLSITCAGDITQAATTGTCGRNVTVTSPTISGNCSGLQLRNNYNNTDNASGNYPIGVTNVVWTLTDVTTGASVNCTQKITITEAHTLSISCPANITRNTDAGVCGANITVPVPVYSAGAGNTSCLILTNNFNGTANASGFYPKGATTVIWTLKHLSGDEITCSQTITVNDNEAPVFTCSDIIINTATPEACSAVYDQRVGSEQLDQKSEYPGPFAIGGDLWQSFIAGKTGKLTTVGLLSSNASGRGGTLVIYLGQGTGGTVLYSGSYFIPSSGWQYQGIPFLQAPTVTAGVQYTVRWTDAVVLMACCYPGGHSSQNQMYDDINFATYVWSLPASSNVSAAAAAAIVNAGGRVNDNCNVATFTSNHQLGETLPVGTTTVTQVAVDNSGNTTTCNFNIIVKSSNTFTSSLTPPAVCSNTLFSYTPATVAAATTFTWSRAVIAGISNAAGSGNGAINETLINTTNDTIPVTYVYTASYNGCNSTQAIVVKLYPVLNPTVTITASNNGAAICGNASVTFAAQALRAGINPVYKWYLNNGLVQNATASTYTNNAWTNNDQVYCTVTAGGCGTLTSANSNAITINVTSTPLPAVTITSTAATAVCPGSSITFIATATNEGSAPIYQWKKNGGNVGSNSNSFTASNVSNPDVIVCMLTSNMQCANPSTVSSNAIVVNLVATPAVTITTATNVVCGGEQATITATATNAGASPGYQWKINGNNAGTNNAGFITVLNNNDNVSCVLTNNNGCATPVTVTSNSLNFTVLSGSPSVSITASKTIIKANTNVVFTAAVANTGPGATYSWMVNGVATGGTSSTYQYAPQDNDVVKCIINAPSACLSPNTAESNAITISVIVLNAGADFTINKTCISSLTLSGSPAGGYWSGRGISGQNTLNTSQFCSGFQSGCFYALGTYDYIYYSNNIPGVGGYIAQLAGGGFQVLFANNGIPSGGGACCFSSYAEAQASYPQFNLQPISALPPSDTVAITITNTGSFPLVLPSAACGGSTITSTLTGGYYYLVNPAAGGYINQLPDGRYQVMFANNGILTLGGACCFSSYAQAQAFYPQFNLQPLQKLTAYPASGGTISIGYATSSCISTVATVAVTPVSADPVSATAAASAICLGNSTTLTLSGGGGGNGAVINWYTGSCGGSLIGTGNNLAVTPATTTTYYGRYEDPVPCARNTACVTVTVNVVPLPSGNYNLNGSGNYCPGNSIVLSLSGSQTGMSYQLMNNGSPVGTALPGNGAPISFPAVTQAGVYTATAFNTSLPACAVPVSGTATVTFNDAEAPSVSCPASQLLILGAACNAILPDYRTMLVLNDNCTPASSLVIVQNPAPGTIVNGTGILAVSFTVTDLSGNSSSCSFNVLKKDNTAPIIITPASSLTVECDGNGNITALNNWLASHGGAVASDGCSNVTWSNNFTQLSDDCGATGFALVVFTATDAAGNSSSASAVFTIWDTQPPVFSQVPATLNVNCSDGVPAALTTNAIATDGCSNVTMTVNDVISAQTSSNRFKITRTWTATDACGNAASASQVINVYDNLVPLFTSVPNNVFHCYEDNTNGNYSVPLVNGIDNCSGAMSYNFTISGSTTRSGSSNNATGNFNPGTSIITWTLTDASGNSSTATTTVLINPAINVTVPSVTVLPKGAKPNTVYYGYAPASVLTVSALPSGGTPPYSYSWTSSSASLVVSVPSPANPGTVNITSTVAGSYTITVTVTDSKGCSSTYSRAITVIDVRCGANMDKVLLCRSDDTPVPPNPNIPPNAGPKKVQAAKENCVSSNTVATLLANGAALGACDVPAARNITPAEVVTISTASVYPNPSNGILQVQLTNYKPGKVRVDILNSAGKVVTSVITMIAHHNESITINMSRYASGMYTAKISNDTGVQTTRIILAR
jgi:hypothetical protein